MPRYRVPRITIGPDTKEIILKLGRTLNVTDKFEDVELHVKRHKCGEQKSFVFPAYAVCGDDVHFTIPDEFITSDVPRGFYIGQVMIDGCSESYIELVKATSRYVKSAESVNNDCAESNWQEPPCEEEVDDCEHCGGLHSVEDDCPDCCDDKRIIAPALTINKDYLGEDDD